MTRQSTLPVPRAISALRALSRDIRGEVIHPEHERYDAARRIFNAAIDRRPLAIVRPRCVADVAATVRYARAHDLPLAIRGGGHHFAGRAMIDGGVTIDLALMRRVTVDVERRIARVEGGALWGDIDRATQPYGLATPGGTVMSVGVAGFTLGGGIGHLSRAHGLAADNLISAEIVTPDGHRVTAREDEHKSLFWAIRGGGGGFGVVTSFEFRLHDVGEVWAGAIAYRIVDAPRVLRVVRDLMITASDDLNVSAVVMRDRGEPMLVLNPCWVGASAAADEAVRPLRDAAEPIIDSYGPTTYHALQSVDAVGGRRVWESSAFLDQLFDDTIDSLVAYAVNAPLTAPRIALLSLGGAISRVPSNATAFGGRGAQWLVQAGASWDAKSDDVTARAWVERLHTAVGDDSTGIGYINMVAGNRPTHSAWTRARLRGVRLGVGG
jgi:FAD/FMN-containing dehydrogenase